MKQCTHCGQKYPDDAIRCLIDEQPLVIVGPVPPILKDRAVMASPVTEGRRIGKRVLTDRQMEIVEVILVCVIAFGSSLLLSTNVFFGGASERKYDSVAWMAQALREGSCLGLVWYLLRRRGRSFGDLGLAWSGTDIPWSFILALIGGVAFQAVYYLAYFLGIAAVGPVDLSQHVGKFLFGDGIFFSTFLVLIINPFFEELIVRAYLMTEVRRLTASVTAAIVISTVLQTSYHFYQGGAAAIAHGARFLIFSIYYAKTNRIAPVVLAHLYTDVGGTLVYWAGLSHS